MKTVKVVAAIIKAVNERMEKQSFLQHSVDMVISKAVGSFRVEKLNQEKHLRKR